MRDINDTHHIKPAEVFGSITLACQATMESITGHPEDALPLSDLGLSQAAGLMSTLSGMHFDQVFSAAASGASETARIATGSEAVMVAHQFGITAITAAPIYQLVNDPGLRNAPLVGNGCAEPSYFSHEFGAHLDIWSHQALNRLLLEVHAYVTDVARTEGEGRPATRIRPAHVFLCSQSIACSTMALAIHRKLGHPDNELANAITRHRLAPCEALKIVFSGQPAQLYTMLLKPDSVTAVTNAAAVSDVAIVTRT